MKNKYVLLLILVSVIGITSFFILEIFKKNQEKVLVKHNLNFEYISLENEKLEFKNIDKKDILLIYFDSGCVYCQIKAEEIYNNRELLKNLIIYFISDEDLEKIENFSIYYKLNSFNNIYFVKDDKENLKKKFNIKSVPFVLAYKKNKIIPFKGSYNIKYIMNELNKETN